MTLIDQLEAKGFAVWDMGGGFVSLVRERDGATDVLTAMDGCRMATDADWMLCTYGYDWLSDVGREQPIDSLDSETSPVHLMAAIEFANATGKGK